MLGAKGGGGGGRGILNRKAVSAMTTSKGRLHPMLFTNSINDEVRFYFKKLQTKPENW